MITINNLSKKFGSKVVLDNVSLTLQPGKVYGIVGLNGAGKTTLFNSIAGAQSGSGSITYTESSLHEELVYLRTNPYMMPRVTGREYIQLVCNAGKVQQPMIDEKNIFQLPLDEYAHHYSTGMKKKLALTAALHLKREVYLLDEPFNGVDLESNMVIVAIVKKLRSLGKIVVVSSHIISMLRDLADDIYLLEDGSVSHHGTDYDTVLQRLQAAAIFDKVSRLDLE